MKRKTIGSFGHAPQQTAAPIASIPSLRRALFVWSTAESSTSLLILPRGKWHWRRLRYWAVNSVWTKAGSVTTTLMKIHLGRRNTASNYGLTPEAESR